MLFPEDTMLELSVLFGIFLREPAKRSSLVEISIAGAARPQFGPRVPEEQYEAWSEYALRGESLVATALKNVDQRLDLLEKWFGDRTEETLHKA